MTDQQQRHGSTRLKLPAIALAAALAAMPAEGAGPRLAFHQAAAPLDDALQLYAAQTGRQMLYTSALVAGLRAPAIEGRLDADTALRRLLAGTPVTIVRREGRLVVLGERAKPVARRPKPVPRADRKAPAKPVVPDATPDAAEIIVTGSNIRGQAAIAPVLKLDATDIARSGFGTVSEAIAALPQNFGGTATEDSVATASDRSFPNTGFGAGVNLRGLGSDATLVLVNGRRVAGAGGRGDFTDLSSIPVGAIARIEILTDGASAIYGSDAVGGVVNMILKKDYEGAETRLRLGGVTKGGARDYQFGQLAGLRWPTGHVFASYEFSRREALPSAARRYTATSDLRALGGNDYRVPYAMPGNVLRFDAALGTYVAAFAIPDGQDGTGLTAASFRPGGNLNNQRAGTDILPRQTRHIGYAYAEQQAGDDVTLFAEGRYARRRFHLLLASTYTAFPISATNPYFVSPTGAASDIIGYSFLRELGPSRNAGTVRTWSAAAGGTVKLGGDWRLDVYGARAVEHTFYRNDNTINSTYFYEALGVTPDNVATAYDPRRDGYFNPYGSGHSNSAALLAFINQGYSVEYDDARVDDIVAKADGALVDLPGGTVRLAVGAGLRWEHFARHGETFYDGVAPTPLIPTDATRRIGSAFAELSLPLVGADNAVWGVRRLLLTAAVRHEHYQDVGSTTNPKLGLAWEPANGLSLRGSWGTSFRAPSIKEVTDPLRVSTAQYPNASGGRTPVLALSGGNPGLKPETARTWSLGAALAPTALKGLRVEANWFQTRFRDRIGRPAFENPTRALRDPSYAPFITLLDPVNNPADAARLQALLDTPGAVSSVLLPVSSLRGIVDGRYVNTAKTVVQGVDLLLSQALTLGTSSLQLSANGTWLIDYKSQVTPAAALVERVATVGNPSDFRSRATISWDRGPLGATLTANYVHGYRDDISVPNRHIASWTTLDAQLRYSPQGPGWAKGLTVSLSITNLLATDPPFVNMATGYGYDPANADPLGRFAALQISKKW
ncbi:hypothetical protein ASE00_12870 [Sphingomonas sp. Root710]|uniref:TonB-dependent receptor n=1 Tax=Sphingomonas sp. Root710 TaxID=1736594 RepID=UPI0006FFEC0F|nr:TonB-dependent receptor [Sphingomonas sp. Root710]KRB82889.1 hypothetical protein ASE00_12870 [Sphingomonas sp. Root710]